MNMKLNHYHSWGWNRTKQYKIWISDFKWNLVNLVKYDLVTLWIVQCTVFDQTFRNWSPWKSIWSTDSTRMVWIFLNPYGCQAVLWKVISKLKDIKMRFLATFGFYVCKEASVIQPIIGSHASCETNNKFSGVSLIAFFYWGTSINDVRF